MSASSERYTTASKQFEDAYNQYAGQAGLDAATAYGQQQADQQAGRAGSMAASNAVGAARSAGLSKAQAALMGEQAASQTTADAYQNIYTYQVFRRKSLYFVHLLMLYTLGCCYNL